MNMKPKIAILAAVLAAILVGCASSWRMAEGEYKVKDLNFMVTLPQDWKRAPNTGKVVVLSRDGLELQQIRLGRMEMGKELDNTKKKITGDMLPQEVAETLIDDLMADFDMANKQIVENIPDNIDGMPGFKITYAFQTSLGLKKRSVSYGFVQGNWVYFLTYNASARWYFDKDYPTFEGIKNSFRLLDRETSS
jgi:hypothetical protein